MSKILALDYGDKRIGVAISDPTGTIASTLATLENKGINRVIVTLKDLCQEHSVAKIVIGVPCGLSGRETEQTVKTRDFINKVQEVVVAEIVEVDERFSSVLAEKQLVDRDGKVDKSQIDANAARLILQDYLDRENN
ncbi:Holliday junction resolvase RuvX [Patescibacteria group bacterium]|nr:Holliday junction resolvase RuvX [Patescibacteria group bacterium]